MTQTGLQRSRSAAEARQGKSPTRTRIKAFIIEFTETRGYPPTVREIGDAVGLRSSSTVHAHLVQLQRSGEATNDPAKPRTIRIVKP